MISTKTFDSVNETEAEQIFRELKAKLENIKKETQEEILHNLVHAFTVHVKRCIFLFAIQLIIDITFAIILFTIIK